MIKRSGGLLLALLYTITVAGFALNLHYCGNEVAALKINAPADSCAKPMAKSKMKCCKDSTLEVKVKDDHEAQQTSFLARIFAFELPKLPFEDFFLSAQHALLERLFDRAPPDSPKEGVSVFLKNCIFRI
jgi:hypothetical protein